MDLFGIGPLEAVFFILIMLIVLGPADMVKVGRTLGTNLRKLWTSPTWRMIFTASDTLRKLPTTLVRESGVEELRQELQRETETLKKMGQEMKEMTQFNLPKNALSPSEPMPAAPVLMPGQDDFAAWTTPLGPAPAPPMEPSNSILPPHLEKANLPQHPPQTEGELPSSDATLSELQ